MIKHAIVYLVGHDHQIHQYDYCVAWERSGSTNTFLLNDQYPSFDTLIPYLQNIIIDFHKKVAKKNPQYNFIVN